MDWTTFLAELRLELRDTGETPKWSTELLYVYFRDGIWAYSQYFPRRFDRIELEQDGTISTKFALPSGFIEDLLVECPEDNTLEVRQDSPGLQRTAPSSPQMYRIDSGYLYLDADPEDDGVFLTYYGAHNIPPVTPSDPPEEGEDNNLSLPDSDIEVLKLYIVARCNAYTRNRQSSIDRYKAGTGKRDDNPMTPEVEDYFARYQQALLERMRPKAIRLHRPRKYIG